MASADQDEPQMEATFRRALFGSAGEGLSLAYELLRDPVARASP